MCTRKSRRSAFFSRPRFFCPFIHDPSHSERPLISSNCCCDPDLTVRRHCYQKRVVRGLIVISIPTCRSFISGSLAFSFLFFYISGWTWQCWLMAIKAPQLFRKLASQRLRGRERQREPMARRGRSGWPLTPPSPSPKSSLDLKRLGSGEATCNWSRCQVYQCRVYTLKARPCLVWGQSDQLKATWQP